MIGPGELRSWANRFHLRSPALRAPALRPRRRTASLTAREAIGHGGTVELNIDPLALRAVRGSVSNAQVRRVLKIALERRAELMQAWRQIAAARAAGNRTLAGPRAVAARYLPGRDRIEIELASGWSVQVPRSFSPRLAAAAPEACAQLEVIDAGLGLHWPALDEDWFVPAVIESATRAHA